MFSCLVSTYSMSEQGSSRLLDDRVFAGWIAAELFVCKEHARVLNFNEAPTLNAAEKA